MFLDIGAKVTITDQKQMLPLLRHNAELNNLEHKVTITEFNWYDMLLSVVLILLLTSCSRGEQTPLLSPPYDITTPLISPTAPSL